jgi:hypothetical protein
MLPFRMDFKKYLEEVESKLRSLDPQKSKDKALKYIGGKVSRLEFLGLKVPQLKKVYKDGFSFYREGEEKVTDVWHYIRKNSDVYEAVSLGLFWFGDKINATALSLHKSKKSKKATKKKSTKSVKRVSRR